MPLSPPIVCPSTSARLKCQDVHTDTDTDPATEIPRTYSIALLRNTCQVTVTTRMSQERTDEAH